MIEQLKNLDLSTNQTVFACVIVACATVIAVVFILSMFTNFFRK